MAKLRIELRQGNLFSNCNGYCTAVSLILVMLIMIILRTVVVIMMMMVIKDKYCHH